MESCGARASSSARFAGRDLRSALGIEVVSPAVGEWTGVAPSEGIQYDIISTLTSSTSEGAHYPDPRPYLDQ